jgi:hypothetical protein
MAIVAGFSAKVSATGVTVTDVTDWSGEGAQVVDLNLPYLGYSGGIWDGINTLQITEGPTTSTVSGFCIDPFHFSLGGPQAYNTIALASAPKYPGPMGAATAKEIEELWTEYFPTAETTPTVAAGLQVAIWELVVDAAAAANGETPSYYMTVIGNDYGAAADIAWVDAYGSTVAPADLIAVTGPGQDYVIPGPPSPYPQVPDGGTTLVFLGSALAGLQGLRAKFGCSR